MNLLEGLADTCSTKAALSPLSDSFTALKKLHTTSISINFLTKDQRFYTSKEGQVLQL